MVTTLLEQQMSEPTSPEIMFWLIVCEQLPACPYGFWPYCALVYFPAGINDEKK